MYYVKARFQKRQRKTDLALWSWSRKPNNRCCASSWWNSSQSAETSDVVDGVSKVQEFLTTNGGTYLLFAYREDGAVGVFAGALVKDAILNSTIIQEFINRVNSNGISQSLLMQVCGSDLEADFTFGIVAATGDSKLEVVQSAVGSWANGTCVTGADGTASLGNITLPVSPPTKASVRSPTRIRPRALCHTTAVASGDSCWSLPQKCGIALSQFEQYNPGSSFCSSLQPGQLVCCSSGALPTPTPKPNGSCASYVVKSGDWCAKIAAANAVTVASLEKWNQNTWGWTGCNNLQAGINMCLSTGTPPMPAPMANALCGPQVPGTSPPASGVKLASLNPCPLNACCDIWGQCGTTSSFCTPSGTGPPGTAAPGTNGCISNCGTEIVSGSAPATFMSVAYFEGWNPSRPCLQMDVGQIDDTKYTHVHFGFGALTANNYQVNISSDTQSQFARFTSFKTPMKKILSIGGWTFSTAPFDYDIFRTGMTAGNRDTMSTNIANFILKNNLNGVDIDWEYPGAPDIPNIPPGSPSDGLNYLAFLKLLKGKLPGKTVSIAAPASYWYLKGFPIADMAKVVDYVVYMTYDLHGQWDYGNQWADPGCPSGSCLRSHVNLTETLNALSMITKAGVPSNMILVGVSSYGRSFGMTTPGCTGPMCKFTGPNSGATPGPCTQTGGYISNAEINMIIGVNNSGLNQFSDAKSDSDILVFNTNQWVAYMTDQRKASRVARYKSLNFGGTSDWAVDLQRVYPPSEAIPDTETFSAIDPTIEGCSAGDAAHVLQAWREAGELVKIHREWSPKGKWQNAMDLYMGTGTQKDWDFWGDPGPVGQNIIKDWLVHFAGYGEHPIRTYAWIYCHEPDIPNYDPDKAFCGPSTYAYTWDDPGWWWSAHYVVLCPGWWDFENTNSLEEITNKADGNINFQMTMENWRPVRARTMLHETYHWTNTVSVPRCQDLAYSPLDVCDIAYHKGTDTARLNAESFAITNMAIYVMKTWGHNSPPTPNGVPYPPGPASESGITWLDNVLDAPPSFGVRPVSIESVDFTWDPSLGAVSLSTYGQLQDSGPGDCQQGEQFWTSDQCALFCPFGKCATVTGSDGNPWYQCVGCPMPGICVNGPYSDWFACQKNCESAQCTQNAGYMNVTCSGCPENTCKSGTYNDLDICSSNCFQGQCSESAGVAGVVCTCP